jgi:flagellar assembly factor FliW
MPKVFSRHFGTLDYDSGEQFIFPNGLPGFPAQTAFLPVEVPDQLPVVYLQSLYTPELCFVSLPVRCIVADYELSPNGEDLARIGLEPNAQPGPEALCLALICFGEDGTADANLRAPLVINVKNHMGVQTLQAEDRYPIRYPLKAENEASPC